MAEKQEKITKEQLEKMLEKVPPAPVAGDSLDDWRRVAPYFARNTMRGIIQAALELNEESRDMVLKEAGLAYCQSLLDTDGKKWKTEGMPLVADSGMSGVFKAMCKLKEGDKLKLFKAMGDTCLNRFNDSYKAYKEAGIEFTPGGYDVDAAIMLIKSQLVCRQVHREGKTIFWDGKVGPQYGECTCCLVQGGVTEAVPEVCLCADYVMKEQFELLTGIPMEAERVRTFNDGSTDSCVFRVYIKGDI